MYRPDLLPGRPIGPARPTWLALVLALVAAVAQVGDCGGQTVHFGEEDFDKVSFSQMTQLEARQKCEEALQRALDLTQSAAKLSAREREKLAIAGRLDIHRFFERYDAAKRSIPFGNVGRDKWQQVSTESHGAVRPLSREFMSGLHGSDSVFNKSLSTMLDADDLARVKRAKFASDRAAYAEQIATAMLVIGRQASLSVEKRQAIKEKLLNETQPPAMFGNSLMPLYFVLANMGDIEDELRGMFSEQEWRVISKLIRAGRTATR
jgi:hypothetical protein